MDRWAAGDGTCRHSTWAKAFATLAIFNIIFSNFFWIEPEFEFLLCFPLRLFTCVCVSEGARVLRM